MKSGVGFLEPNFLIAQDDYGQEMKIAMDAESMAYLGLQLLKGSLSLRPLSGGETPSSQPLLKVVE